MGPRYLLGRDRWPISFFFSPCMSTTTPFPHPSVMPLFVSTNAISHVDAGNYNWRASWKNQTFIIDSYCAYSMYGGEPKVIRKGTSILLYYHPVNHWSDRMPRVSLCSFTDWIVKHFAGPRKKSIHVAVYLGLTVVIRVNSYRRCEWNIQSREGNETSKSALPMLREKEWRDMETRYFVFRNQWTTCNINILISIVIFSRRFFDTIWNRMKIVWIIQTLISDALLEAGLRKL